MLASTRRPRFEVPDHFDFGIYHCVSRVVDLRLVMGPQENEQFVKLMRLYDRLYGLWTAIF